MITGRRVGVMFHSEHRMIPWLREINPDPPIEIHPETAAKYGIKDGDWVLIEGTMGKAKRKAKITPLTHPEIVVCQHGWWIPEADVQRRRQPVQGLGHQRQPADPHGQEQQVWFRRRPHQDDALPDLQGEGRRGSQLCLEKDC